jgi:hypothetical protein
MFTSPQDAIQIPLHDADFLNLTLKPNENGLVTALLKVKLHPDEPTDSLKKLGVIGSEFYLVFQDCLQVKTNVFGSDVRPETISDFSLVEKSELKEKLLADGMTSNPRLVHFKLDGSKGSQIDVIATAILVTDKVESHWEANPIAG